MKGNKKIIEALNDILTAELTGINQYFLHGKMCKHWGFERLSDQGRQASIDEMKHAESLIDRILLLGGIPNVQKVARLTIGETVPEQMKLDHALELDAVKRLNKTISLCRSTGDHGSAELLEPILGSEEEHLDWLETQISLIKQLGEAQYLAQHVHKER